MEVQDRLMTNGQKAETFFYNEDDIENTLFYKEDVKQKVKNNFQGTVVDEWKLIL